MAATEGITNGANGHLPGRPAAGINFGDFHWQPVDDKINVPAEHAPQQRSRALEVDSQKVVAAAPVAEPAIPPPPPLGSIRAFSGTFTGRGFNMIFRPRNTKTESFSTPVAPESQGLPADNVLELNLTRETLAFSDQLGSVPNRGFDKQEDIFLNGVTYLQIIDDITDSASGTANPKTAKGIHAEPGVWMHIPQSKVNPKLGASLCRMASIPHGTTINAQCLDTPVSVDGPPLIPPRDPRPFIINKPLGTKFAFDSLNASEQNTARIPQNLAPFIKTASITQATLADVNDVLKKAIKGQKITRTITFTVSTNPGTTQIGGGTANIAFLRGQGADIDQSEVSQTANADAAQMESQFWIETVETEINVPAMKASQDSAKLVPDMGPLFIVNPPKQGEVGARKVKASFTQIQYSQLVLLNFGGLAWPHISVATLVPQQVVLDI